jgi:Tfp pilus assembly protein PilN
MTNEEINNGLDEMQRKIIQQSERIALLNNAIDEFKKQCDNIVKLTKTKQDEFNKSVPDDEL